jgi:Tfp pilus assembly protein PilX
MDKDKITQNRGIALLLALFLMVIMSLIVVVFLDTVTIDRQITTNQVRAEQASFIAGAGIENAVYELRQDSGYSGTGGAIEFPLGSGNTYNVTISGATITSVGKISDFMRTIES